MGDGVDFFIGSQFSMNMSKILLINKNVKIYLLFIQGVMDAYVSIAKQEGFRSGLYRGTGPNIARFSVIFCIACIRVQFYM